MSAPSKQRLPGNLDAEKGVIGSILLNPSFAFEHCGSALNGEYFNDPRNAALFEWLKEASDEGRLPHDSGAVDLIALCDRLETDGKLKEFGGRVYLTHLCCFVPTAAAIDHYTAILRDKYVLRRIIK